MVLPLIPLIAGGVALGGSGAMAGVTGLGNGSDSGLGLGQQRFKERPVDKNAFTTTQDGQRLEDQAQAEFNRTGTRMAPQMQSAQVGAAGQTEAARMAANERIQREQLDRSEDRQARQGQQSLVGDLQEAAAGRGPSLAGMQLREAQDRNSKQAMSMAASMRGGNAALAQRNATNAVSQGNQQAARDSAQMKVQEQLAARQQLQGTLDNMRGQDIGVAGNQAQLNMGANQFNSSQTFDRNRSQFDAQNQIALSNTGARNQFQLQQAQLNQEASARNQEAHMGMTRMNDQAQQHYYDTQAQQNEANRQAAMGYETLETNRDTTMHGLEAQAYENSAKRKSGFIASLAGMAGGIAK
jgi:hypothetical protein